jgi:hypothetical protein
MRVKHAIWIRTAKTAGTSIETAFLDHLVHCGDVPHFEESPPAGYVFPAGKIICLAPNTAGEIPRFVRLHPEVWAEAVKFGVVRNPYDRFVSGWKYLRKVKAKPLREVILDLPISGPEYAHLTLSQVDLLAAGGDLANVHLLRFERLQQDLDDLCDVLGIERRTLPLLNRTPDRDADYMGYYTEETRALVAGKFNEDFELLGYAK